MLKTVTDYLSSWKFWAVLLITVIIFIYIFHGGNRNYEIVGIKPLQDALGDGNGNISFGGNDVQYYNNYIRTSNNNTPIFNPISLITSTLGSSRSSGLSLYPSVAEYDNQPNLNVNTSSSFPTQLGTSQIQLSRTNNRVQNDPQPLPIYTVEEPEDEGVNGRVAEGGVFSLQPHDNSAPQFNRYRSRGEEMACRALGQITGKEVRVGVRDIGIINPETGYPLEIDCLSDGIGVEYNGEQHYVYPNKFHKTRAEFESQIRRDQYKTHQARQKEIFLIPVPYTVDSCKMTANGPQKCKYKLEDRYTRIYDYIYHILDSALHRRPYGKHYTTDYMAL